MVQLYVNFPSTYKNLADLNNLARFLAKGNLFSVFKSITQLRN